MRRRFSKWWFRITIEGAMRDSLRKMDELDKNVMVAGFENSDAIMIVARGEWPEKLRAIIEADYVEDYRKD